MVFAWHFIHTETGHPVPFKYVPALFPFSLIEEGHTGVALFMTLSGYLFAKLLDGKSVRYGQFLLNRALRLLPLLLTVILIVGLQRAVAGDALTPYITSLASGLIFPTLPNGGWSITVELHFYLIFPLLLWLLRRSRWMLLLIVAGALLLRTALYLQLGEVHYLAYATIVGRIDQFTLGMLAFHLRHMFAGRHVFAILSLAAFALFFWYFNLLGGFFNNPSFPSPSPIWIVLPTAEAAAYAITIVWYDSSFSLPQGAFSRFLGRIGTYSYSIYLLHFFFVFNLSRLVHEHLMDISNFYLALLWALACFLMMVPVGYLSYRFVEAPFLSLRRRYAREGGRAAAAGPALPRTEPPSSPSFHQE